MHWLRVNIHLYLFHSGTAQNCPEWSWQSWNHVTLECLLSESIREHKAGASLNSTRFELSLDSCKGSNLIHWVHSHVHLWSTLRSPHGQHAPISPDTYTMNIINDTKQIRFCGIAWLIASEAFYLVWPHNREESKEGSYTLCLMGVESNLTSTWAQVITNDCSIFKVCAHPPKFSTVLTTNTCTN